MYLLKVKIFFQKVMKMMFLVFWNQVLNFLIAEVREYSVFRHYVLLEHVYVCVHKRKVVNPHMYTDYF